MFIKHVSSAAILGLLTWFTVPNEALAFDCDAAQTTTEQIDCLNMAYTEADDELNNVYNDLNNALDEETTDLLVDAQRKWLTFRDASCEAEMSLFKGGSIAPLLYSECLTRVTWARVADLQAFQEMLDQMYE